MINKIQKRFYSILADLFRQSSHSSRIEKIVKSAEKSFQSKPVFIEIGCGATTPTLGLLGKRYDAKVYSIDLDNLKIEKIINSYKNQVENIEFMMEDSLSALRKIEELNDHIDFVFLDSAASALQTFKEFVIIEPKLNYGANLLIDNAKLPNRKLALTASRKGKIIVPYLLAHPNWKVIGYPLEGDSMVGAIKNDNYDDFNEEYERRLEYDLGYLDYKQPSIKELLIS